MEEAMYTICKGVAYALAVCVIYVSHFGAGDFFIPSF